MKRALVAVTLLALGMPALAQEVPDGPGPKDVVIRFLGLTADQTSHWQGLLDTLGQTVGPLREQLQAVEQQLGELLEQDSPDPTAVGNLVLQAKALRVQIGEAHETYVADFEALLTSEQLGKLGFVRRADRAVPLLPAFRVFGLLPPLPDRPPEP